MGRKKVVVDNALFYRTKSSKRMTENNGHFCKFKFKGILINSPLVFLNGSDYRYGLMGWFRVVDKAAAPCPQ